MVLKKYRLWYEKNVSKKARSGKDLGKKNNGKTTGFNAVDKSAMKKYHSKKIAEKVAGAQFQKMKRKGML